MDISAPACDRRSSTPGRWPRAKHPELRSSQLCSLVYSNLFNPFLVVGYGPQPVRAKPSRISHPDPPLPERLRFTRSSASDSIRHAPLLAAATSRAACSRGEPLPPRAGPASRRAPPFPAPHAAADQILRPPSPPAAPAAAQYLFHLLHDQFHTRPQLFRRSGRLQRQLKVVHHRQKLLHHVANGIVAKLLLLPLGPLSRVFKLRLQSAPADPSTGPAPPSAAHSRP